MARRARPVAALAAILAAGLMAPAHGGPLAAGKEIRNEGCIAMGTHQAYHSTMRPWDCQFVATGEATYVAATPGAYVISISRDNGKTWLEVAKRAAAGPPQSGIIPSRIGDLVSVSISCWDYTRGAYCRDAVGGRYGVVAVHSRL